MTGSPAETLALLHEVAEGSADPMLLTERIAADALFHSPVMHTPQHGKLLVMQYLRAALQFFSQHGFRYVRTIVDGRKVAVEFTAEINGVAVNGVTSSPSMNPGSSGISRWCSALSRA